MLLYHACNNAVKSMITTEYGTSYIIEGPVKYYIHEYEDKIIGPP